MKHTAPQKTAGRRYTGLLSQFMWLIGVLCVLVLLTSTLFSMRMFQNTLVTTVEELEADYLKVQTANVESLMHRYCSKVYEIAVDAKLRACARSLAKGQEDAAIVNDLRTQLYAYIQSETSYVAATVAMDSGEFFTVSRLHDSSKWESWFSSVSLPEHDAALADLCQRAASAHGLAVGTTPDRRERNPARFFHLACPLYDLLTKERYATVIVTVNSEALAQIVNPELSVQEISTGMLLAWDGTVLCHSEPDMIGSQMSDVAVYGENMLLLSEETMHLGFEVYRMADRSLLMGRATRDFILQNVAIILLTAVGFLTFSLLLRRMTRSTRRLLKGIERLGEGESGVCVEVTDHHEIGQITQAFNHLSDQLEQAREREAVQARQTLEALHQQHHAEMQALERQINAHFLYNTLNTINYTAIESGSTEVSQQIRFLGSILRYSFENSNQVVTTKQVMAWLDDYLTLQKLRFGNSFDYTGQVDGAVQDWPMRKLLIQPFVENAVLHGFRGRNYGCVLQIRFQPFGKNKMRVTIIDNGAGISPDAVQALNRYFRGETEKLPFAGVGLKNARQRLLMYYAGEAKVFFRSCADAQTVVTLILPKYKDRPEFTQTDRRVL